MNKNKTTNVPKSTRFRVVQLITLSSFHVYDCYSLNSKVNCIILSA